MLDILARAKPEHLPGEKTSYHYLTFGWLVDGLVRGVTGESLRDFVKSNMGEKLDIGREFMIGVPGENVNGEGSELGVGSERDEVNIIQ